MGMSRRPFETVDGGATLFGMHMANGCMVASINDAAVDFGEFHTVARAYQLPPCVLSPPTINMAFRLPKTYCEVCFGEPPGLLQEDHDYSGLGPKVKVLSPPLYAFFGMAIP